MEKKKETFHFCSRAPDSSSWFFLFEFAFSVRIVENFLFYASFQSSFSRNLFKWNGISEKSLLRENLHSCTGGSANFETYTIKTKRKIFFQRDLKLDLFELIFVCCRGWRTNCMSSFSRERGTKVNETEKQLYLLSVTMNENNENSNNNDKKKCTRLKT